MQVMYSALVIAMVGVNAMAEDNVSGIIGTAIAKPIDKFKKIGN